MKTQRRGRLLISVAAVGAAGIALAGCSGGPGSGGGGGDEGGGGDNVVTIYGTIADTEAELLEESWAEWEEENGIDIQYESSKEFEAQIAVRAQGGNAPDIAIFPQPGLLADMARRDFLKPAPQSVQDNVAEYWTEDWANYGTVDGTLYGAPLMASVKGWVWYSPADFEARGAEIPETWDELLELTATFAEEDSATYKPWCVGFGSGDATGWPGTDWVEDLVLRLSGPEVYDQWVVGEVQFSDPEIRAAFEEVEKILLNPEHVNGGFGGVESIVSTTFNDGGLPILDGNCSMHHQASFYEAQWPEGTVVAPDGDIWAFITPKINTDDPDAVTGGGEIVAKFVEGEAVDAVQTFLSSDTWANLRVDLGGVISANKGLDPNLAKSDLSRAAIEILQGEDTIFRFDGSDLMPAAVGTSSFWTGMNDWVVGTVDTDELLAFIDSTWP